MYVCMTFDTHKLNAEQITVRKQTIAVCICYVHMYLHIHVTHTASLATEAARVVLISN